MRIMILIDFFPPFNQGGAGVLAFESAKILSRLNNDILVFASCPDKKLAGGKIVDGLKVYFFHNHYNSRWRGWIGLCNRPVLRELRLQLEKFKPDIVQAHNIHTYISYSALKLTKKFGAKVFFTAHDVNSFHDGKFSSFIDRNNLSVPAKFNYKLTLKEKLSQMKATFNPLRNMMIKYFLSFADKIFAVSYSLKEAMTQNGIKNVEVIYNGISIGDSHPLSGRFRKKYGLADNLKMVLMAGRLHALKGVGLILDYVQEIKKFYPDFIFVYIGEKNVYTDNIMKKAEELGLDGHLIFIKWVDHESMKEAYTDASVVITPSLCLDTFNLTNIEAMIEKKPVVGTCFGGTAEIIIDGETGYIVNPLNTGQMGKKISSLLRDDKLAVRLGKNGYDRVIKNFSLLEQVKKTLVYYQNEDSSG